MDDNSDKKVDGLKINRGDLQKSRKIVLETIGEEEKKIANAPIRFGLDAAAKAGYAPGQKPALKAKKPFLPGETAEKKKQYLDKRENILKELGEKSEEPAGEPSEAAEPKENRPGFLAKVFKNEQPRPLSKAEAEKRDKYLKSRGNILKELGEKSEEQPGEPSEAVEPKKNRPGFFAKVFKNEQPRQGQNYAPDFKNISLPPYSSPYQKNLVKPLTDIKETRPEIFPAKPAPAYAAKEIPSNKRPIRPRPRFLGRQNPVKEKPEEKKAATIKKLLGFFSAVKKAGAAVFGFIFNAFFGFIGIFINTLFIFFSIYVIFIFVVTAFGIDNAAARTANRYLPVPAIISGSAVVNYYWYMDEWQKNFSDYQIKELGENDFKNDVIKNIIFLKLLKKYELSQAGLASEQDLKAALSERLANDLEINQVPISRINKIRKMILSGGNFPEIAEKYGDEQGDLNIALAKVDAVSYKNAVENMKAGDISGLVIQPEGYYIFHCRGRSQSLINLRYVLVKAVALDDYLSEKAKNFRHISLVNK